MKTYRLTVAEKRLFAFVQLATFVICTRRRAERDTESITSESGIIDGWSASLMIRDEESEKGEDETIDPGVPLFFHKTFHLLISL